MMVNTNGTTMDAFTEVVKLRLAKPPGTPFTDVD